MKPNLSHIQLKDLASLQLQEYYVHKLGDLSVQTIKHHHQLLLKALNDAVGCEILRKNVVKQATPPMVMKYRTTFYSKDELDRLMEAAKSSVVYFPIIFTGGYTVARLGELRVLQWEISISIKDV